MVKTNTLHVVRGSLEGVSRAISKPDDFPRFSALGLSNELANRGPVSAFIICSKDRMEKHAYIKVLKLRHFLEVQQNPEK